MSKTQITEISRTKRVEDKIPDDVVARYVDQGWRLDIVASARLFADRRREGNNSVPVIMLHSGLEGQVLIIEEAPDDGS